MPIPAFDGARFRELREARGLSREAVAVTLSKAQFSIFRYESGKSAPSLRTIGELAAVVGVSPLELIIAELPTVTVEVVSK